MTFYYMRERVGPPLGEALAWIILIIVICGWFLLALFSDVYEECEKDEDSGWWSCHKPYENLKWIALAWLIVLLVVGPVYLVIDDYKRFYRERRKKK